MEAGTLRGVNWTEGCDWGDKQIHKHIFDLSDLRKVSYMCMQTKMEHSSFCILSGTMRHFL